jgi:hypothetical protein
MQTESYSHFGHQGEPGMEHAMFSMNEWEHDIDVDAFLDRVYALA